MKPPLLALVAKYYDEKLNQKGPKGNLGPLGAFILYASGKSIS
jgi:hypothetical protein